MILIFMGFLLTFVQGVFRALVSHFTILTSEKLVIALDCIFAGKVADSIEVNVLDRLKVFLNRRGVHDFFIKANTVLCLNLGTASAFWFMKGLGRGKLKLKVLRRRIGLILLIIVDS
jgi:hypothetical protein